MALQLLVVLLVMALPAAAADSESHRLFERPLYYDVFNGLSFVVSIITLVWVRPMRDLKAKVEKLSEKRIGEKLDAIKESLDKEPDGIKAQLRDHGHRIAGLEKGLVEGELATVKDFVLLKDCDAIHVVVTNQFGAINRKLDKLVVSSARIRERLKIADETAAEEEAET